MQISQGHFTTIVYVTFGGQTECIMGNWKIDNDTHSLTNSILIYLFIKLELNNFLLPPLLSIVFVQECSVIFQEGFHEGRLERRTFLPKKWRAWYEFVERIKDHG